MLRGWRILVLREPRTTMRSHSSSSKSRSLRHRSAELDMARLDAAAREKAVSDACGGVRRSLELEEREQALQRARTREQAQIRLFASRGPYYLLPEIPMVPNWPIWDMQAYH